MNEYTDMQVWQNDAIRTAALAMPFEKASDSMTNARDADIQWSEDLGANDVHQGYY